MKKLVTHSYIFQPQELISFTVPGLKSKEVLSGIVVDGILAFEDDWWLVNAWRKNGQKFELVVYQQALNYWQEELGKLGYQLTAINIPTGEFDSIQITKLTSGDYLWVEYHDTFEGLEFLEFSLQI